MRIVRFRHKGKEGWGIYQDDKIKTAGLTLDFKKVKLLAPAIPSKIILVGLNYRDHARELKMPIPKEPIIFLKPATALIGPGEDIIYPRGVQRLDYEAELALVIKKKGRNIPSGRAGEYILGYTCLNDVTARDIQKKDGQWMRAKSFDTFCPLGPWLETVINPANLKIKALLNGKVRQDSSTADLIFTIPYLVGFISRVMTLLPGDIISTGTPVGVGPMQPGDTIKVNIEGIGEISNRVRR